MGRTGNVDLNRHATATKKVEVTYADRVLAVANRFYERMVSVTTCLSAIWLGTMGLLWQLWLCAGVFWLRATAYTYTWQDKSLRRLLDEHENKWHQPTGHVYGMALVQLPEKPVRYGKTKQ